MLIYNRRTRTIYKIKMFSGELHFAVWKAYRKLIGKPYVNPMNVISDWMDFLDGNMKENNMFA